jgi:hypothetical protein
MDAAAVGKRATLIPRITALDGHAGALALLHAAAWAVEPVQRSRGWAVGALLEFVPANPGLLVRAWWGRRRRQKNEAVPARPSRRAPHQPPSPTPPQGLNIGGGGGRAACIKLRLRRGRGSSELLPFDDVVHTLLHELAHCARGPHDATFYALLDALVQECDAHRSRGVGGTGAGFDSRPAGRAGGARAPADPAAMRAAAAAAAAKRAAASALMPAGPRSVGGGAGDWRARAPGAAAVDAAARRAADDRWCGGREGGGGEGGGEGGGGGGGGGGNDGDAAVVVLSSDSD